MLRLWQIVSVAGCLLFTDMASATFEVPCTFLQPILTYDAGVTACLVTYTCQFDPWSCPGYSVLRTFAPNQLGSQYGFENRNAAWLAGLRCELVNLPRPPGPEEYRGLFGDTLKVNVVVPPNDSLFVESTRFDAAWKSSLPDILDVTVRCMKLNASQEFPRFKFLAIEVHGVEDASTLEGVFAVQPPDSCFKSLSDFEE